MREVLREGRTQSRVALEDVTSRSGAVAVGALAGLGGEITIVDGETWIARSVDGVPEVTGPGPESSDDATVLTASHVDDWIEIGMTIPIPELAMFRHKVPAPAFHEMVMLARRWTGPAAMEAGFVESIAPLEKVKEARRR